MQIIRLALIPSAIFGLAISEAAAAPALGLIGDKTLVMFDTESLAISKTIEVNGVDKLVGIDLRPGNKTIVGVTPDQQIVSIDLESGTATQVSKMDKPMSLTDKQAVIVDFNPMADRLRFMSGTTNHRVHPDTGEVTIDGVLAFEDGDINKGAAPNIVAAAYTNSIGKPEKTAMFNIDATEGTLIQQTKPNDGTLETIGKLGITEQPATYAFDIHGMENGKNTAYLVGGKVLYTVNLESGAATKIGTIKGIENDVRSISILPVS